MRLKGQPAIVSLLIFSFLLLFPNAGAAAESVNPLIEPYEITEYTQTTDQIVNILLLGIDLGMEGYWGSGYKNKIEDCHTDAVMVVAINLDQQRIDLISLPRDTVTYVPGVRGIYKLNAAMNCAQSLREGLENTKRAAERLLGNIKIDYNFAVDMQTMIALGDQIGGADVELEMRYQGSSGKWYHKGLQHLSGMGIMDYVRARTNATVNYTDIGRTNRQRETMLAIFRKLRNDEAAVLNLLDTAPAQYGHFVTDIDASGMERLISLLPVILGVDAETVGSHVLTGSYRSMLEWNFTFTDQDNRLSVLQEVYGIAAQPTPYVSTQYAQWLRDTGFSSVHYISVAREFMETVNGMDGNALTDPQKEAYGAFEAAYQSAVSAFSTAADSLDSGDTRTMESARKALRDTGDACAQAIGYAGDLPWQNDRELWYEDPYINEYQLDWR
ncbi:MAG: LCP family protein [Bacillota bacterium]